MDGHGGENTSFDNYRIPEALWQRMLAVLPQYKRSPNGGRPRKDLRRVADAIFYRLRTGCQWKAIPPQLCPGSTAWDYFAHWVARGVFEKLWELALDEYDDLRGLDWRWQCVDGAMTKAPLGGNGTGKNPTDRAKGGTKRSLMTEAAGIPVGLVVAGANVHDSRLLVETVEDAERHAPGCVEEDDQHLCLDAAYQGEELHQLLRTVWNYTLHVRGRGEEQTEKRTRGERARRWVVERTHGWLNRFRAILLRWDKRLDHHLASLQLACAYYTAKQAGVFG